ncbi:uncharacterized protein LY89DRAFT_129941 [Mollisia scopiformis]|uniref:DUF1996 domain-containing protein n=1 Tax=Mollisia scopiformis TaxID=149040 RepID=A0A194X4W5_MOLSC|nr:uncharacterized protein LY89DRAFT_129941 [Mollisia scopiformis]KUJ15114.1 hypothetical protein LY89DRAFT_129941 [Mollisia scopiformis]
MYWNTLTVVALLGQSVRAQNMLRFGCSQLSIERADTLENPGVAPSPHTHQIVGGNSFNITMTPVTYDPSVQSTCTSCTYSEDFGNYWTASLYFQSPDNGTFQRVPQMANGGLTQNGGLTVYYMPYSAKNNKMTAFPPGFRMKAGEPTATTDNRVSICHRCLGNGEGFAPCDAKNIGPFPDKYCPQGIRASIIL